MMALFPYCISNSFADALRIVKDRKYGARNADERGGWDGMVGELVRNVSHIFDLIHFFKKKSFDKLICIKIRGKPIICDHN